MENIEVTQRLEFLAKQYDVFDCEKDKLKEKQEELTKEGFKTITPIKSSKKVLGLISTKRDLELYKQPVSSAEFSIKKYSICVDVFTDIVKADPTDNKMFVQWMLNIFNGLLKGKKSPIINESNTTFDFIDTTEDAIRFVIEDLPQAKEYLILFEANKRKKKFKELCSKSFSLKGITDYSDINQYKSLSQLFDAVDPFIERDSTEMESLLQRFVSLGEAEIPVKDRKFTVYIPLTRNASIIFEKYAGWCTARKENSNFTSYTNQKRPDGRDSKIYIVINNNFFEGKSDELYQIHFESGQLMNKSNSSEGVDFYGDIISKSEALSNYFYDELIVMAKQCNKGIENNKYLDFLLSFGFTESLFEIFEDTTEYIRVINSNENRNRRIIPKLPDLSKFKNLKSLILIDVKLTEIPPSIGNLLDLDMISLANNKLTKLPKEITKLKKLSFINISGNKITEIPDDISKLDKINGGSLGMMSLNKDEIGSENFNKLKTLLPSVSFNLND